jgi:hypothetical protein
MPLPESVRTRCKRVSEEGVFSEKEPLKNIFYNMCTFFSENILPPFTKDAYHYNTQ